MRFGFAMRAALLIIAVLACAGAAVAGIAMALETIGGPPRYHACGRVSLFLRTPVYAHNTTCSVAVAVAKGCSRSRNGAGACFGEFPLPYTGRGEPTFPRAPVFRPLGFECWQTFGPYTAGLPPPPRDLHDPKPIICVRQGVEQQLVAYIV